MKKIINFKYQNRFRTVGGFFFFTFQARYSVKFVTDTRIITKAYKGQIEIPKKLCMVINPVSPALCNMWPFYRRIHWSFLVTLRFSFRSFAIFLAPSRIFLVRTRNILVCSRKILVRTRNIVVCPRKILVRTRKNLIHSFERKNLVRAKIFSFVREKFSFVREIFSFVREKISFGREIFSFVREKFSFVRGKKIGFRILWYYDSWDKKCVYKPNYFPFLT